jgi:hypothetical protein
VYDPLPPIEPEDFDGLSHIFKKTQPAPLTLSISFYSPNFFRIPCLLPITRSESRNSQAFAGEAETMAWQSLSDHTEIRGIFDTIIQKGASIEIHFSGEEETFFSRALAVSSREGGVLNPSEAPGGILLRDLSPRLGNDRIRTCSECEVLFSFRRFLCRFQSAVLCERKGSPHPGHLIEYPAVLEVEEKRKEERLFPGAPGFFSAVFSHTDRNRETRFFELSILNFSGHGLGLLVREGDSHLLQFLHPGDPLGDVTLYGEALLMKLSSIVRHVSPIEDGPYAGEFVLGLQSEESLEAHFDAMSVGLPYP